MTTVVAPKGRNAGRHWTATANPLGKPIEIPVTGGPKVRLRRGFLVPRLQCNPFLAADGKRAVQVTAHVPSEDGAHRWITALFTPTDARTLADHFDHMVRVSYPPQTYTVTEATASRMDGVIHLTLSGHGGIWGQRVVRTCEALRFQLHEGNAFASALRASADLAERS